MNWRTPYFCRWLLYLYFILNRVTCYPIDWNTISIRNPLFYKFHCDLDEKHDASSRIHNITVRFRLLNSVISLCCWVNTYYAICVLCDFRSVQTHIIRCCFVTYHLLCLSLYKLDNRSLLIAYLREFVILLFSIIIVWNYYDISRFHMAAAQYFWLSYLDSYWYDARYLPFRFVILLPISYHLTVWWIADLYANCYSDFFGCSSCLEIL